MSDLLVRGPSRPLVGTFDGLPGDKSIGHRALLFGALCQGRVRIRGLSQGEDNRRTRTILRQLGVDIEDQGSDVVVDGVGLDGLLPSAADLDCGNSGTTMRLLCGLLSGARIPSRLVGDEYLHRRPMKRVIGPLEKMGAVITGSPAPPGKRPDVYPPLSIAPKDRLQGISYESPIASAQVKTAVLLAGLYADGVTEVSEPVLSRDHTERMLRALGAPIAVRGTSVRFEPEGWDRRLTTSELAVPRDLSAAAFLMAAATVIEGSEVTLPAVGTNPSRTGFLDALAQMGGDVTLVDPATECGEPVSTLVCRAAKLKGTTISGELATRAIDELPILAVLAAYAEGPTTIADAAELRVKESDRVAATVALLRAFGVEVEERPDGMIIAGGGPKKAGVVESHGDHRIAMSAAVCALGVPGESTITDVANIDTSFPGFSRGLFTLGADLG